MKLSSERYARIAEFLIDHLPKRVTNALTLMNLGRLTAVDKRLHTREVPTITIEEITGAIRVDEGQPVTLTREQGTHKRQATWINTTNGGKGVKL